MIQNGSVNKADVITAARAAIDDLPKQFQSVANMEVVEDGVRDVRGDWIIPILVRASSAFSKSYELHRCLTSVQESIESKLHVYATVILEN